MESSETPLILLSKLCSLLFTKFFLYKFIEMEIIADGWILQIFSDTIVYIYIGGFACEHPAWIV